MPVLLVFLSALTLPGATFTASLDRESVPVGESVTLTLQVEGADVSAFPGLPAMPNVHVASGGMARNVTINNGQVSSTISQTYLLTPMQPGQYSIPTLSLQINGQVLTSQPLKFTAVKGGEASQPGGEQLAFLKLFLPKKEVFVGEVFPVELQVCVRNGVANAENILAYFDGYNDNPIKAEGFSVVKTAHARRRSAQIGSAVYTVATLVTALTPVKTGDLTIGSIEVNLVLQLPSRNQRRRDPFFDPFGMFQQYEEKRAVLAAEPEKLTVHPLPAQNVPSNFNGGVGEFTLNVTAGPTNVTVGEPITVKIQLSGRGALDSLALPAQATWSDFKTYPPTAKVESQDPLGLQGTKTFEQVVVPQTADIKALPAVAFSYFDPAAKGYKTLSQPPIALTVRPVGSMPAPSIAVNRSEQDHSMPSQDIVHIKQRLGSLGNIQAPVLLRPWFLVLQALPLLVFVGLVIWRRHNEKFANNPRLRRKKQVERIVQEGLNDLRNLAAQNKSDEFFAGMFRLLQEQLGERLDLPASAITEAVIDEKLRTRGVVDSTIAPLQELFQACNAARYAPVKSSQELAAFVPKVEAVIGNLKDLPV